jgi:hypothetical protein
MIVTDPFAVGIARQVVIYGESGDSNLQWVIGF